MPVHDQDLLVARQDESVISRGWTEVEPPVADGRRDHHVSHLDSVETHTAILFFAGDRVYKLKKPVNLGFVDFRTRRARLAACEAEVTLNRRLAPDVYVGIADIRDEAGVLRDHMVVMQRMPAERRLSALVGSGTTVKPQLRVIARQLAVFHERCQTSPEITAAGSLASLEALWLEGMTGIEPFRDLVDGAVLDEIGRLALRYLRGRAPLLAERRRVGRVRDGHGDLLTDDIYCLDDGPRILDCIEFDQRLRVGDVLGDVAFLAMDLERLGAPDEARYFLDAYREFSGENHPASLADLYIAYRAFVRAKVTCIRDHQGEAGAADTARELAGIALRHLRRGRVRLVLVGGLPGTGKSTLSDRLVESEDGWVRIDADTVRKGLAGLPAYQPAGAAVGQGLYTPENTDVTYAEMLGRAWQALRHGESVVLDASWISARHRELAARVATETDSDLVELRCVTAADVATSRIARRATLGSDASDASRAVYEAMAAQDDPWPTAHEVITTGSIDEALGAARRFVA